MSCDNSKADIPIGIFMCSFIGLIMGGLAGWFVNSFIIYIFVILTESILKIDVLAIFAGGTFGGLAGGFLGTSWDYPVHSGVHYHRRGPFGAVFGLIFGLILGGIFACTTGDPFSGVLTGLNGGAIAGAIAGASSGLLGFIVSLLYDSKNG